jgi:hypothetical protein
MANSKHDSSQNNGAHKKFDAKRRMIEPPRTAPETERRLTHSPYFNGLLYQRRSQPERNQQPNSQAAHTKCG